MNIIETSNEFLSKDYIDHISDSDIKNIMQMYSNETNPLAKLLNQNNKYIDLFITYAIKIINSYESNSLVVCVGNTMSKIVRFQELIIDNFTINNIKFIYLPLSGIHNLILDDDIEKKKSIGYTQAIVDKFEQLIKLHNIDKYNVNNIYLIDFVQKGKTLNYVYDYFIKYQNNCNIIPIPVTLGINQLLNELLTALSDEKTNMRCIRPNFIGSWVDKTIFNNPIMFCNITLVIIYLYYKGKIKLSP